jgi:general stress protein CsbA
LEAAKVAVPFHRVHTSAVVEVSSAIHPSLVVAVVAVVLHQRYHTPLVLAVQLVAGQSAHEYQMSSGELVA